MDELNRRYASDGFEFIPIYGRRRVGKTALIDEFIKDKPAIKFTAVRGSIRTNLRILASKVLGIANAPDMNLEEILEIMHARYGGGRYVLAIDEYPYLVQSDESTTGILNNFIESHLDSKAFIILSGSSMNIMRNQVLGSSSPLYGRRTGQIRLRPFPFHRLEDFLPDYTAEERLIVYGLVGGIPWYLGFFSNGRSLKENIIGNLVNPYAVLNKEATLLFAEEFDAPVSYHGIIASIAKGHTRVGEIASDIGLDTARVSVLLRELMLLDIVAKYRPIDAESDKKTRYRVKDPYLRAYFRFLYPDNVEVPPAQYDRVYEDIMSGMPDYLGHVFEDVCSEFISEDYRTVGTWWGTDPKTRRMEEIDLAAIGDGHMLLCECKYRNEAVDADDMGTLIRRSWLVKNSLPKRFMVFSKSGYTDRAVGFAEENGIALYTLEDIACNRPRTRRGTSFRRCVHQFLDIRGIAPHAGIMSRIHEYAHGVDGLALVGIHDLLG